MFTQMMLELQVLTIVFMAVVVGYLVGTQWFHTSQEGTKTRVYFTFLLIVVPLAVVLPITLSVWAWLLLTIISILLGMIVVIGYKLALRSIWNLRNQWSSDSLMTATASMLLASMGFLNIAVDFHWLKILPLSLVVFTSLMAYQKGKDSFLANWEMKQWIFVHAIAMVVVLGTIVVTLFLV